MDKKVILLMGSQKDMDFSRKISKYLRLLGLDYEYRIASAHKTPEKVLAILAEYENEKVIYITIAGRSNALSALVDANTLKPVIACPPYSEKYSGVDIFSSLRVPSGVGLTVTIEPEGAAIAAAKIFAVDDKKIANQIKNHLLTKKQDIEKADNTARQRES